jgi:hypothetical protein
VRYLSIRWRPAYPLLGLLVLVALGRGVLASAATTRVQAVDRPGSRLPGLQTGAAPWSRNAGQLRARLARLGLPALAREGTALHIHQHLDVFVDGKRVIVPAGIGIGADGLFISPIHTHDSSGVIHVESPFVRKFTLGELFGVWGVRFTRRCLGGYCAGHGKSLRVYVNGRREQGDPRRIPLTAHEEIAVAFGAPAEQPRPIPSRYAFPLGL